MDYQYSKMQKRIQILSSEKIDSSKWDQCVEYSKNPLIWANYYFLTKQCDQWSGLIIDNYETILPLPWREKFGIKYLYAPAFIQQLGFFGNLINLPVNEIWECIIDFAKFGDLFFNYNNLEFLIDNSFHTKTNYVLDLNKSYCSIHSSYSHDLKKNLQKSEKKNLNYSNELGIEAAIDQFQAQYQQRFPQYKSINYSRLKSTCIEFSKNNKCITRSINIGSEKKVLAMAVLLKDQNRLYLLLNATSNAGRTLAANHYLIDRIIQEFSEEPLLLDFEGSERNGIKEFYKNFHPINQPYFHVRFNKLPFWAKWIKSNF